MNKPRNKDIYDDIVYEIQKLILKGITTPHSPSLLRVLTTTKSSHQKG